MLLRLLVLAALIGVGVRALHDGRRGAATPWTSVFLERHRDSIKGADSAAEAPSSTSQNGTHHRHSEVKGADSTAPIPSNTSHNRTNHEKMVGRKKFPGATQATPGLAFGLLTIVSMLGFLAWKWYTDIDEEEVCNTIDLDKWRHDAGKGQLDFYTCMALHCGRHDFSVTAKRFFPRLFAVLCMQLLLGVLIVVYQARRNAYYPVETDPVHRVIGVLLYLYSARRLYLSMYDECRQDIENVMFIKHVSGWYSWPILFGELMNTGVCISLLFILYLILADCTKPQFMLINAIAINFIADVDNEFVTDEFADEAMDNLTFASGVWDSNKRRCHGTSVWDNNELTSENNTSNFSEEVSLAMLFVHRLLRLVVPIMIFFLAFVLLFAHNESVCKLMYHVEPWPFCYENVY